MLTYGKYKSTIQINKGLFRQFLYNTATPNKETIMATEILIKHSESGLTKKGLYGFSWTYLFFGWFVPLFRGEIPIGFLHLLINLITFGIFQVVMCFKYNEQYMSRMITSGWELAGSEDENRQAAAALGISYDSNVEKEKTTTSVKEITSDETPETSEDKLQNLADMKEKGLINEDEFNSKKEEILKDM